MIDSRTAVQSAIYDALNGNAQVTALADVWQNPPENTEPTKTRALVIIGLAVIANIAPKDGGLDEVTIEVLTYSRQPDATEVYAVSAVVRNALEMQPITAEGALIEPPEFVSAEPSLLEDGQTYQDVQRFRMIVQPA